MENNASGDWQPTAALEVLKLRARLLERIRAFFSERGVLEVRHRPLRCHDRSGAGDPRHALYRSTVPARARCTCTPHQNSP
jgi:hypothetical protein